ncbi:addiction module protein [bacterium]|nr:addiction module protein [bacterium]
MKVAEIPEIKSLSLSEKILLVEDLWDSIALESDQVPVPQSHIDELEERLSKHQNNPDEVLTLEELQERIEKRK